MKIGILTQPLHNNYGGLLQNYALQQVLKGMGHEVETLDWKTKTEPVKEWLWGWKQRMLWLKDKTVERPRYQPTGRELLVMSQNTHRFIEKYISVCPQKATTVEEFGRIGRTHGYEAYVVGSDQVWRPSYSPLLPAMFLSFAVNNDVKRLAYAASFGTSTWEFSPEMTNQCANLVKKFDLVTVREKSGVVLCHEHLGVEATHVLDPTMLLDKEDYIRVVEEEREPKSAGTLFHYILDPSEEKKALVESVATSEGLNPVTIMPKCQAENRTKWDVKNRIEDCVFPSVTSWLRGFMDAKMVIVDSFHGAVFSIIFNKPFWVIANAGRGNSRFESLLKLYGLEERMISPGNEFDLTKEIDWMRVNAIREKEKNRCIDLLRNSLS